MNRLLYAAALIAVALPSVVFAGTNQTYDEYATEKCAQQGLTPEECMLTRPDDPAEGLEPPMHDWPENVELAIAEDLPFFRYDCMSEGWLCPRHVGVWGRDEDRANDSNRSEPDRSERDRSNARADTSSSAPSGDVDRPSRDRDTDRGRSGRSGRDRSNPCRN